MSRKNTRRPAPAGPPPGPTDGGTAAPAPRYDRVAHYHELKKQYPPVPVQLVKTPILEFVDAAGLFQDTMHKHVTAYVEGDRIRKHQLFAEAEAICTWVGGLCLAARQVGYQLTNFDPVEVERRCQALADVCMDTLRTKTAYQYEETNPKTPWLKMAYLEERARLKSREERRQARARLRKVHREGAYTHLAKAYDAYFPARNAVFELALAVRPELWELWPFRPPGEVQTVLAKAASERIPEAEAEILVRNWLMKNAKENPAAVTRDAIAAGTGVSTGMVSYSAAWIAFRDRRDAEAKRGVREVPLSETMLAAIPANCARPDELAALVEEQQAEKTEEKRRHKRRHKPS